MLSGEPRNRSLFTFRQYQLNTPRWLKFSFLTNTIDTNLCVPLSNTTFRPPSIILLSRRSPTRRGFLQFPRLLNWLYPHHGGPLALLEVVQIIGNRLKGNPYFHALRCKLVSRSWYGTWFVCHLRPSFRFYGIRINAESSPSGTCSDPSPNYIHHSIRRRVSRFSRGRNFRIQPSHRGHRYSRGRRSKTRSRFIRSYISTP